MPPNLLTRFRQRGLDCRALSWRGDVKCDGCFYHPAHYRVGDFAYCTRCAQIALRRMQEVEAHTTKES